MLHLASSAAGSRRYVAFERPQEVQSLSLKGLGYFKRALGMGDYRGNLRSWITRPGPVVLGCIVENALLGWCTFEKWDRSDRDKTPIYVLRMIEVGAEHRGQKIGLNLMTLAGVIAPGHLVTRPLSANSQQFFEALGFLCPPEEAQIDFHDKFGYLLLPSEAKQRVFSGPPDNGLGLVAGNITACADRLKTNVLRQELSRVPSFAQAFMSTVPREAAGVGDHQKTFIKTDTSRIPCACGSVTIAFHTLANGQSEQISVECAKCGNVWLTVPI